MVRPPKVIQKLLYRADGEGYLKDEHSQLFLLSAEGGSPRQLTSGPYDHAAPVWTPDGKALLFSANRRPDGEYDPLNTEIYELTLADRRNQGPDQSKRTRSATGNFRGRQAHRLRRIRRRA